MKINLFPSFHSKVRYKYLRGKLNSRNIERAEVLKIYRHYIKIVEGYAEKGKNEFSFTIGAADIEYHIAYRLFRRKFPEFYYSETISELNWGVTAPSNKADTPTRWTIKIKWD